jgi:hypothetical protein
MINSSERLDDDPTVGHPDVRTRLTDASYFFLGNGLIQAAIQWAPHGDGTPLGLLVMDPERLGRKRDALTMDPERGLSSTALRVLAAGRDESAQPASLRVGWTTRSGVPAVEATWRWQGGDVTEVFFCPDTTTPRLAREVVVTASPTLRTPIRLRAGAGSRVAEAAVTGAGGRACFLYTLSRDRSRLEIVPGPAIDVADNARRRWADRTDLRCSDPQLDRLARVARFQLGAAVSAGGRMDARIWQHDREGVRDQALVAIGLVMAGDRPSAACLFRRLLREFVTADGSTIDAGEVHDPDDVELDQNGALLHALEHYTRWTGDLSVVEEAWDRVEAVAEFPLRPAFAHPASGLLHNSREFWGRHRAHGIEPGLELAYQLFVSVGLSAAASLARQTGRVDRAERWSAASARLRAATLTDPVYALVADGAFVKRRNLDGSVQDLVKPEPDLLMPYDAPLRQTGPHALNPDTCTVLPIAMRFVPGDANLAGRTLDLVEPLWNQSWEDGGYGRYQATSEPDAPAGWPVASLFAARAAVEAGRPDVASRVLRWLDRVPGAPGGSWFESYGGRTSPRGPQGGVIPWTWSELLALLVDHVLGVQAVGHHFRVRPRLLPGIEQARGRFPIGTGRLLVDVTRDPACTEPVTRVRSDSGPTVETPTDRVLVRPSPGQVSVEIILPGK